MRVQWSFSVGHVDRLIRLRRSVNRWKVRCNVGAGNPAAEASPELANHDPARCFFRRCQPTTDRAENALTFPIAIQSRRNTHCAL
jgi:hypothetical protein